MKVSEMDNLVAEFFLRRQENPRANVSTLFSALKLVDCDDNVRLKKTAVLRDISNCLLRGTVDEGMLDLLEILEKLLLQEHSEIMGSLKLAYCWTAAECTLKFMWPVTASHGFLSEALERIWKKRIGILKERESNLVTHELLKWESDLKKAIEEPEIYQKIRETNIRYNAICYLNPLLKDQWALLGCSLLESEAQKRFRKDSKMNEQEQEHELSLNNNGEDISVARELKDFLLEIQGLVEKSHNNAMDQLGDVTPQPNGETRIEDEDDTSGRVRPHLPTPEPLNVSPLKKKRWVPQPRKPVKFWKPEEIEALKKGVEEYGKSWKDIKNSNPVVFVNRSEVDLKDKWRNLLGRKK